MQTLWQDIRYSARMLLKHPAYTLIAVITLALGIGANAAIFSIINEVLLRSLPYQEPDRVVTLWENNTKENIAHDDVSPANFLDWRERQQVFSDIAFVNPNSLDYAGIGGPEVIRAAAVSKGFFEVFGGGALYGRTFLSEEYAAGKNQVVMLSHGFWQRRFGGDKKSRSTSRAAVGMSSLPNSDCRSPIADCRLPIANCRFPILRLVICD